MNHPTVYILLYNGSVQYAAKNVKNLWVSICAMCDAVNQPMPLSYVQVTRILNDHISYTHATTHGHAWEIISRKLLYTRRKRENGVTTPPELINPQPNT